MCKNEDSEKKFVHKQVKIISIQFDHDGSKSLHVLDAFRGNCYLVIFGQNL